MIYVFLANGFEEVEALATVDMLRRAKLPVQTVGVGGKTIIGSHNIPVIADISDSEIDEGVMECVVLPGGVKGTENLENSTIVSRCIKHCSENNLTICAICAAPSILGHMGLLSGKRATCYPGYESELTGALCCGDDVSVDGNFITGKGAGVSIKFGLAIVEKFLGAEAATKIEKAIQCP